jgi:hypothetical protein
LRRKGVESKIMLRGCFSVAPVLATKETQADLELCNQAEQAGHRDPKTISISRIGGWQSAQSTEAIGAERAIFFFSLQAPIPSFPSSIKTRADLARPLDSNNRT